MDPDTHLTALASEGAALGDAADGRLDRPVATCPDWDMAQLVTHVGMVHTWVRAVVAAGGERVTQGDLPAPPDDKAELIGWYRGGLGALVEALQVDPDTPAWTFSRTAPDTVGWWRRRQALETALHRWDAQAAAGQDPAPIAAQLALDGIEELLSEFAPGLLEGRDRGELAGSFHVHATDASGEWWLDFDAPDQPPKREHAKADTAVRGPASGLYLWLWNRQTPEEAGLEVFGRREVADAWREVKI
jgi:uncharacterized protein (TIGR03083 family)